MPGLEEKGPQESQLRLTPEESAASCGSLLPCSGGTRGMESTPALKTVFLEISVFLSS